MLEPTRPPIPAPTIKILSAILSLCISFQVLDVDYSERKMEASQTNSHDPS
jgi:hypothetical protein